MSLLSEHYVLDVNGRDIAKGTASACYSAAYHLGLARHFMTHDGNILVLEPGVQIEQDFAGSDAALLSGDGAAFADGSPLPEVVGDAE